MYCPPSHVTTMYGRARPGQGANDQYYSPTVYFYASAFMHVSLEEKQFVINGGVCYCYCLSHVSMER